MERKIILHPDKNRLGLESKLAKELESGIVPDSIQSTSYNLWEKGEKPRVLLIVPPYTRIKKPLEVIRTALENEENTPEDLHKDNATLNLLQQSGITHLEEMKRAGVPMGLLRIGTAAKERGYDIKILDATYEGWNQEREYFTASDGSTIIQYGLSKKEIAEKIKAFNPHIVGITVPYTHQWGNAREIADLAKTLDEKVITIMGGTHVHGLSEDALRDSPTDYVVRGQADITFPQLLDFLTKRPHAFKNIDPINGIVYKKGGKIQKTANREFMSDISDITIPDLDLIPNLRIYSGPYHSAGKRKLDHGHLLYGFTSIGCNTGCTFCAIPSVQGGYRATPHNKLDEYLSYIKGRGVTEFMVEDDHLFHDPERALEVFATLKKYQLPWVEEGGIGLFNLIALLPEKSREEIESSVRNKKGVFQKTLEAKARGITTEDVIKAMAESGCYSSYLAVESANNASLSHSHKPTLNAQQMHTKKVIELFSKYGIKATCGLMLGFINPTETGAHIESRNQIEQTIEYGRRLREWGAAYINPFIVTPLPGAPDFEELLPYARCNTDLGYSHEFGTMDAPTKEWTATELDLLRVEGLIRCMGIEGYKTMLKTGTWPV